MARRIVDEEMRFSIIVNGDKAQKELLGLEKANRDLLRSNKSLRTEQRRLERQGKQNTVRYKELSTEISKNSTKLKANYAQINKLEQQVGVTNLTMAQLQRRLSALNIAFRNGGGKVYAKQIRETKAAMAALRAETAVSQKGIGGLANGFNKYAALGASFIAVATGVVFKMQQMIDFNGKLSDAQADVMKTTGLSKKEVDELSKSFGILNTRTSRIDLLKIAEEGGRIGIAKEEISEFVDVMNKAVVALSDSFPGGVEETASKLGKLKGLFPDSREKNVEEAYNGIGSAINDLGAQGVATEVNIANFATRVGSLPDVLKPSTAEALALGAGFEESGIQAEIAGRAYNIVLGQAAENGEKFGKIMGISGKEVEDLINEDALAFMLQFSKSLEGMTATEVAQTLEYLKLSGIGATQVLGALSNNTDRFNELIDISNTSLAKGTSLTDEYNIKNNNLAATLEKVGRFFRGAFANPIVTGSLTALIEGFAKMVGIIKDVNKEFAEQSNTSLENAKSSRKLANESTNLLNKYEELTQDGIIPTKEQKAELDIITLRLRDNLGQSVMSIDAETGAFKLNTAAVREQIKIKRLAADEEAATLASRLVGVKEEQKLLQAPLRDAEKEFELRKKFFESKNAQDLEEINNSDVLTAAEKLRFTERLEGFKELESSRTNLTLINRQIEEQLEREIDLTEKLKELNFNPEDAQNFISPESDDDTPTGPKEGDRKNIGGQLYIYRGGKWVVQLVPTSDSGSNADSAKKKKELKDFYQEERELQNELISDNFQREMAQLMEQHLQKIETLRAQLVTEGELTEEQMEANGSIRRQMRLQDEIFENKYSTAIEKGYQENIADLKKAFEAESELRKIRQQEEINALGDNQDLITSKKEAHRLEDIAAEEAHIREVIAMLQAIGRDQEFEGFDLDLLSEQEKETLLGYITELETALKKLNAAKGNTGEGNTGDEFSLANATSNVDVLGMTAEDWFTMLDNLDQVGAKFDLVMAGLQAAQQLYSAYSDLRAAQEARDLQRVETNEQRKQEALERKLNAGLINQRQYDQALEASELEVEKKRAEIAYNQAKRERVMALSSIAINTAQAIVSIWAQVPKFDFGISAGVLTGFVSALGALQAAAVLTTPLPARGFQDGLYPVRRDQDGKLFNARYGGQSRSGLVDFPTVFMAGEEGGTRPEMIINGTDYNNFSDSFKQSLHRELGRVKGFSDGYYQNDTGSDRFRESNPGTTTTDTTQDSNIVLAKALNRNSDVLERLERDGVMSFIADDMEGARRMKERISEYEKYRNQNRR